VTVARVVEEHSSSGWSPLVALNDVEKHAKGDRPLYLVHGGYGDVMEYATLVSEFCDDLPVCGIRARGMNPSLEPDTRVEDMAAHYVEHVRRHQPKGPYRLLGYSLGGMIAFEMARELAAMGGEVEFLGIIDCDVHESILDGPERVLFEAKRLVRRAMLTVAAPTEKLLPFVRSRAARVFPQTSPIDSARSTSPALRRVQEGTRQAYESYRPGPYAGSATFFRAKDRRVTFWDPHPALSLRVWSRVAEGGLMVCNVPGGHGDCIQHPHARHFARLVSEILAIR
jgi:thioesterase domain-containing protein